MRGKKGFRGEAGQTITEFALVFPLVFFLILGVIQFAFIYTTKSVLNYAAHAAARSASVYSADLEETTVVASVLEHEIFQSHPVLRTVERIMKWVWVGSKFPEITVYYISADEAYETIPEYEDYGEGRGCVKVDLKYRMPLIIPIVSRLLEDEDSPGRMTLRASSVLEVEKRSGVPQ
jgi:hypothetical protein